MLLERLPLENLGEQVRGILVGRDVLHLNDAGAPLSRSLKSLRSMWRASATAFLLSRPSKRPRLFLMIVGIIVCLVRVDVCVV